AADTMSRRSARTIDASSITIVSTCFRAAANRPRVVPPRSHFLQSRPRREGKDVVNGVPVQVEGSNPGRSHHKNVLVGVRQKVASQRRLSRPSLAGDEQVPAL